MKNNTAAQTTCSELKFLDSFFKERCLDMSVVKAHGFLTAVASFPDLYMPRDWLPILVSDLKTQQPETAKLIIDGTINMYQQISSSLQSDREFKFLLSADYPDLKVENAEYAAIQEWCKGYCLALVWKDQEWLYNEHEYITNACSTFFIISDLLGDKNQNNQVLTRKNLSEIVKSLYVYWLSVFDQNNHPSLSVIH